MINANNANLIPTMVYARQTTVLDDDVERVQKLIRSAHSMALATRAIPSPSLTAVYHSMFAPRMSFRRQKNWPQPNEK